MKLWICCWTDVWFSDANGSEDIKDQHVTSSSRRHHCSLQQFMMSFIDQRKQVVMDRKVMKTSLPGSIFKFKLFFLWTYLKWRWRAERSHINHMLSFQGRLKSASHSDVRTKCVSSSSCPSSVSSSVIRLNSVPVCVSVCKCSCFRKCFQAKQRLNTQCWTRKDWRKKHDQISENLLH